MTSDYKCNECTTDTISIYLAGNYDDAVRVCREFCCYGQLCVTVERCTYVYAAGAEEGVRIGIVNYPRFPDMPNVLLDKVRRLGFLLCERLFQKSVLIETGKTTYWYHKEIGR